MPRNSTGRNPNSVLKKSQGLRNPKMVNKLWCTLVMRRAERWHDEVMGSIYEDRLGIWIVG